MEFLIKNKGMIGGVLLFVIVFFIYSIFNSSAPDSLTPAPKTPIGADLLKISTELSAATLSQELFSNPSYRILTDFSIPLLEQPVGRSNPFDIIGRD